MTMKVLTDLVLSLLTFLLLASLLG